MPPEIVVVGAGAIGLYYGGRLAGAGFPVHLQTRSGAGPIADLGLTLRYGDGREDVVRPASSVAHPREIGRPVDCVLVTIKSTANGELADLLPPVVGPDTEVITLQNGIGNVEAIARVIGREPLGAGLCFVCVNRTGPAAVENTLEGLVRFAPCAEDSADRLRARAGHFRAAGIRVELAENLHETLWLKLVWNIPFNGLAIAGGGLTTDRILADPRLRERVERVMREVQAAARAEGYAIPDAFLQKQVSVTEGMGAYQPSSLIDYQLGRPVEVEAIWGEPLRRARAAGADVPELARLDAEIRERVSGGSPGG